MDLKHRDMDRNGLQSFQGATWICPKQGSDFIVYTGVSIFLRLST